MILDHFGVIDRDLRLYITVGSNHPVHGIVAYLKYVPISRRSIWCYNDVVCFERVLRYYSVENVKSVVVYQDAYYDPYHGTRLPIIPRYRVFKVLDPRKRTLSLLKSCSDELECLAAELLVDVRSYTNIHWNSIGITGSLLFRIHNVKHSDIDIVLYGEEAARRFIEAYQYIELLRPLSNSRLSTIVNNLVRLHRIPIDIARLVYSVPRRGIYRGKEVTIVFSHDRPLPLDKVVISQRCVKAVIYKEEGDIATLMYPAYFKAYIRRIDNSLFGDYIDVLSYESAYSIPMFFGGTFEVSGLLQQLSDGSQRLVLGVFECDNYLRRADVSA